MNAITNADTATRPVCDDPAEQAIIHTGFAPTDRTIPAPSGNGHLVIWVCQCGDSQLEVLPGYTNTW